MPLTRQQMRNCLFAGQATKFLREESNTNLFLETTGRSLNKKNMRDREFINRFCAFQTLGVDRYKGDMDTFLADCLSTMNKMTSEDLEQLSSEFRVGLKNNKIIFGKHAFRKHTNPDSNRSVINASLWDVMSTGLSKYPESVVESKAAGIRKEFFGLMVDSDFSDSITLGTNQVNRVCQRFDMAHSMLADVLK